MRRVIVIAVAGASLAGCSSIPSLDYFKSTPPTMQVQLEFGSAGRRCQDLAGAGLQDPLLGLRARARYRRLLRQLRAEQVPAGHRAGAGDPQFRRSHRPRNSGDRSQSGGRGTSAGGSAAEAVPQADAAEKAEATAAAPCRRLAVPRSERRPAAGVTPHRAADRGTAAAEDTCSAEAFRGLCVSCIVLTSS